MATTKCISANGVKKNAATIVMAGNLAASPKNSTLTLSTLSKNKGFNHVYQAVSAASSGNLGTISMFPGGNFAYMTRGQYVMKLSGKYINGVATNLFLGGANRMQQRAWNKQTVYHTSFLYSLTWAASRAGQPVLTKTVNNQTDTFGTDDATVDIGEYVIRTGKSLPTQGDYQPKFSN